MVFYSPPKNELKLNYDKEMAEEDVEEEYPWPDTKQLFGDDPDYQSIIHDIMELIDNVMESVGEYSRVSESGESYRYCA